MLNRWCLLVRGEEGGGGGGGRGMKITSIMFGCELRKFFIETGDLQSSGHFLLEAYSGICISAWNLPQSSIHSRVRVKTLDFWLCFPRIWVWAMCGEPFSSEILPLMPSHYVTSIYSTSGSELAMQRSCQATCSILWHPLWVLRAHALAQLSCCGRDRRISHQENNFFFSLVYERRQQENPKRF